MAEERKVFTFEAEYSGKKYDAGVKKSAALQKKHLMTTTKLTSALDKATRGVTKDINHYDKASKKALSQAAALQAQLVDATDEEAASLKTSISYLKEYEQMMGKLRDDSQEIEQSTRTRLVGQTKEIKKAKELLAIREAISELHGRREESAMASIKEVAGYGGREMGEEMADSLSDALGSITSRDLQGFGGAIFKAIGAAGKGLAGAGMRMSAGGGGAGALGKVLGKMGPMLNTIAKLGPLVTTLSSLLLAVVKFFLDADAAAKDFNKSVLASSSSAEFLTGNLGYANAAAEDLKKTMMDMFVQATSLDNLQWGISKETHQEVLGALGAEGVSLKALAKNFEDISTGVKQSSGYVKDWGSLVQMSVGYSRTFGVSLQELTSFQGEMMSEIGMGVDNIQAGFEQMRQSAADSGIVANKFFAQIRSVSADMSLFNMRMGDAAKLMSKLDKAMSPRKAAEFFQTITKFFKGMGLMDRAKMVLMAGQGKTKGILKKDLDQRVTALANDLEGQSKGLGDELKGALGKKGQLVKFLAKHDKELNAEQRDAIVTAARQSDKIARGGIIDLASALKDASPFAAMDEVEAMSKRMFGKPLEELTDVQIAAVEQAAGINDEQLDQFAKLKSALDVQKETIASKIEEGTALTDEESGMMRKLGITFKNGEKDAEAAEKLRHKDSKTVWDNMDKSQKDLLRDSAGTLDFAKKQGEITQSIMDKMGVLMDWLMGKLYPIFADIWDSILDLMDKIGAGDADKRKLGKIQAQAIKDGNQKIADLAQTSISADDFRHKLLSADLGGVGKSMVDVGTQLDAALKKEQDLTEQRSKAQSNEEKDNIEKQLKSNDAIKKALQAQQDKQLKALETQLGGARDQSGAFGLGVATRGGLMGKRAREAGGMVQGFDQKKLDKFASALEKGNSMTSAAVQADLTSEELGKLMEKMRLTLSPEQLGKVMADASKGDPQQAASTKTDGTTAQAQAAQTSTPTPTAQTGQPPPQTSAAQQAGSADSTKPLTPDDMKKQTDQQGQNMQDSVDDLRLNMKKQSSGIVFNGPYLKNQFGGQLEDSVYNAASRALFEYYMYSDLDRDQALKAIKAGINPRDVGASFLTAMKTAPSTVPLANEKDIRNMVLGGIKGNADGGLVKGHLPGNEMLASVAKGERIVPAGGGGGEMTVKIVLDDRAKGFIRAEAHNASVEAARRTKYR